jgi:DNA-binding NtrC family response regulator
VREIKSLGIARADVDVRAGINFYDEVSRFEADLIRQALIHTDGHQGRAARLLGLGVTTLNSMIKRYGISPHHPALDGNSESDEEIDLQETSV